MRLVVNRPATVAGRFLMNVKSRLATNIKVSFSFLVDSWQNKQCLRQRKQHVPSTSPRREHCCRQRQPE
jgi:hypothetical protein